MGFVLNKQAADLLIQQRKQLMDVISHRSAEIRAYEEKVQMNRKSNEEDGAKLDALDKAIYILDPDRA